MIIDALFPHRCSPLDLVVAQAMVIPEEKEDEEKERGGEEGGEPGPWVQHGMTEEDYLKKVRAHFRSVSLSFPPFLCPTPSIPFCS